MIAASLDPAETAVLLKLLGRYLEWCRTEYHRPLPGLVALEAAARHDWTRLGTTTVDDELAGLDDALMDTRLAVDLDTAATLTGLSRRQLERHADAGELPLIRIGTAVRVLTEDLRTFLTDRRTA